MISHRWPESGDLRLVIDRWQNRPLAYADRSLEIDAGQQLKFHYRGICIRLPFGEELAGVLFNIIFALVWRRRYGFVRSTEASSSLNRSGEVAS